jgi:hypothetical protein
MKLMNSRRQVLFFATVDEATKAEACRRAFVMQSLEADRKAAARETPPFSFLHASVEELSEAESSGQEIRLRYQSKDRETVLFGRVSDVMSELAKRLDTPVEYALGLRRLSVWERRPSRFDWAVVIETGRRDLFEGILLANKEWLGIGIEFRHLADRFS